MTDRDVNLMQVGTCVEEKPSAWRDSVFPSERDGQPTRRAEKGHVGKLYFISTPVVQISCKAQAYSWVQMPFLCRFNLLASAAFGGCLQLGVKGVFMRQPDNDRQPNINKVVASKLLKLNSFDNLTTYDNLLLTYTHTRTRARHVPTHLILGCQVVGRWWKARAQAGFKYDNRFQFCLSVGCRGCRTSEILRKQRVLSGVWV